MTVQDLYTTPTLLLLGGTADGKAIAQQLSDLQVRKIYSVAGLTDTATQPIERWQTIQAGFSQYAGLENYLAEQQINIVIDATHPFAATISLKAQQACQISGLPYWHFQRQPWQSQANDLWQECHHWSQVFDQLSLLQKQATGKKSILFTSGQPTSELIRFCQSFPHLQFYLRCIRQPDINTENLQYLLQRGPFTEKDELDLFKHLNVGALVCKNSGGQAVRGKLLACRVLQIPVFMLMPPAPTLADRTFTDIENCVYHVRRFFNDPV